MKIYKNTIMLFKDLNHKQVLISPIKKCALTFLSIITVLSNVKYSIAFPGKGDLEVDVFHVGQGNCVLIKVPYKEEKFEYMLVDAGTSEAVKRVNVEKAIPLKKKSSQKNFVPSSPQQKQYINDPQSDTKPANPQKDKEDHSNLIKKILGKIKPEKKVIGIKSFLITHPDMDHYSLLPKLLSPDAKQSRRVEDIIVENIILGGLPSTYYYKYKTKDINSFISTLKYLYDKQTDIYFTAIGKLTPISKNKKKKFKDDFDNILLKEYNHQFEEYYTNIKFFDKAFLFNNNKFNIDFLCANSLHVKENDNVIRLADDACPVSPNKKISIKGLENLVEEIGDTYSNNDSIVLKLSFNGKSMLLTGDATGLVTNRMTTHPYVNARLKTDVLLAAHHGSSTHNSNNEEWLNLVNPKYIIISNGLKYGHPSKNTYNNFKNSSGLIKNLKQSHWELVAVDKTSNTDPYVAHKTYKAIFSTLTNGDININFSTSNVNITTIDKQYELKEESEKDESEEESCDEDALNQSVELESETDEMKSEEEE